MLGQIQIALPANLPISYTIRDVLKIVLLHSGETKQIKPVDHVNHLVKIASRITVHAQLV
jgi:hypothetical protein